MIKSDTIGKIAEALCKAQGEMQHASKTKTNPFFNSSYADFPSILDACREPLVKNNIALTQTLEFNGDLTILNTLLLHSSGEYIGSQVPLKPVKADPQSMGSCITYMKRFSLAAICGTATAEAEDDDANAASGKEVRVPDCSCGGAVIRHKSGKGYVCVNWSEESNQHVKFPNSELEKYCRAK